MIAPGCGIPLSGWVPSAVLVLVWFGITCAICYVRGQLAGLNEGQRIFDQYVAGLEEPRR